jgi:hypothetical protein
MFEAVTSMELIREMALLILREAISKLRNAAVLLLLCTCTEELDLLTASFLPVDSCSIDSMDRRLCMRSAFCVEIAAMLVLMVFIIFSIIQIAMSSESCLLQ